MQIDTGSCERTDVLGHLAEVVNSLISVGVQLVQSSIDLRKVGALFLRVGQNGLNRIQLEFVLFKTLTNAFGKAVCHLGAGSDSLSGKIAQGNDADGFQSLEMRLNSVKLFSNWSGFEGVHAMHQRIPHGRDSHFDGFNALLNRT